jgi:protein SCO1/2
MTIQTDPDSPNPDAQQTSASPPAAPAAPPVRSTTGGPASRWPIVIGLAVVVVAGLVVGQVLVGRLSPRLYAGTVLQSDDPAPAMDGLAFARTRNPVDVAAFDGDLIVVFFGYTNCPDVCPAAMALTAQAVAGLSEDDQARTRVWLVSVDPERDDPETLQNYVELFNPAFDGITGSVPDIDRVSTEYGVFYQIDPTEHHDPGSHYLVDHTASLFGIGPDGALRIVWPPSVTVEELRADIQELLS